MKKVILSSAVVLGLFNLFSSCNKIEGTPNNTPVEPKEKGTLSLNVVKQFNGKLIGANPLEDTLENGRKIIIDKADFYLCDVALGDIGNLFAGATQPFVLVKNSFQYNLGEINEGDYYKLKFKSGLTTNYNMLPSTYDYYLSDTSMWYNPTNNDERYIHMKIEGMVDTSANKNGSGMAPLVLWLGGGSVTSEIEFDSYQTITKNANTIVIINVDFGKLFKDIDVIPAHNRIIKSASAAVSYGDIYRTNVKSMFTAM